MLIKKWNKFSFRKIALQIDSLRSESTIFPKKEKKNNNKITKQNSNFSEVGRGVNKQVLPKTNFQVKLEVK